MRTTRRTVAVVGAMVAVGATTLMGIAAGTASAQAPGRCLENVNVRAEPSIDARIVAVCEAGTAVQTDRIRDGFVQLTDLGGWAAAEYIEIDGEPAGAPGSAPRAGTSPTAPGSDDTDTTATPSTTPSTATPSTTAPSTRNTRPSDDDEATTTATEDDEPAEEEASSGGGLGGLL
jgi:uncharacterized protein YraI